MFDLSFLDMTGFLPIPAINGIMAAVTLLILGAIPMTQLRGGIGQWLFVSWVGIPGMVLGIGLLVNQPSLLFGALFFLGVYTLRS